MNKRNQKLKRQRRTRAKINGTKERLRLSVFRSNKFMYAQLIDDGKRQTVLGVSEKELPGDVKNGKKVDLAKHLGMLLAKNAVSKKIKNVLFDRGSYRYHGRVKAFAEGAREGGLQF